MEHLPAALVGFVLGVESSDPRAPASPFHSVRRERVIEKLDQRIRRDKRLASRQQ